jgi:hypothetical protein
LLALARSAEARALRERRYPSLQAEASRSRAETRGLASTAKSDEDDDEEE